MLKNYGIRHQTTTPYTPEQNGVAERLNRTIVERARCMLFDADLQTELWAEAVATAVYIINRSPTRSIPEKTPEEMWSGVKPDLKHLRVFGTKAMVHIPKVKRRKFDPKSEELIMLGYSEDSKAYRLLNLQNKRIIKSRDVIFFEKQKHNPNQVSQNKNNIYKLCSFPDDEQPISVGENDEEIPDIPTQFDNENSSSTENEQFFSEISDFENSSDSELLPSSNYSQPSVVELRRSTREPKPKKMPDFVSYLSKSQQLVDPCTVKEALSRADANL